MAGDKVWKDWVAKGGRVRPSGGGLVSLGSQEFALVMGECSRTGKIRNDTSG